MSLFRRSSLDEPWSTKQVLALVLYLVFLSVSVWATGQSLARSVNVPVIVCYGIGMAALLGASFCLGLIRSSIINRRPFTLIFGISVFLFLWLVSLVSNTHNFYFVSSIDDIRQEELREAKNSLEQMKDKGVESITNAERRFTSQVEGLITSLEQQIRNEGNPGIGPKARIIIDSLSTLIQGSITILDNRNIDELANDMASQIRQIVQNKLIEIQLDEKKIWLNEYLSRPDYNDILGNLNYCIDNFDAVSSKDIKQTLRNAFSYFNKSKENIDNILEVPFFKDNIDLGITALDKVPSSIIIENIANSLEYIKSRGDYNSSRFVLSFIWALTIDAAAFMLFYFGFRPSVD